MAPLVVIARDGDKIDEALQRWRDHRRTIFYPKSDVIHNVAALARRKTAIRPAAFEFIESRVGSIIEQNVAHHGALLSTGGTYHAVFSITAERQSWILKASLLDEPAFHFLIESWAMAQLRAQQLPALEIPAFRTVPDDAPFAYLLVEEAKGGPLKSFEDPNTQAIEKPFLAQLGSTVARYHEIKTTGAGLLDPINPSSGLLQNWPDYIRTRLEEHIKVCEQINAVDSSEAADIRRHFEKIPAAESRLLHGDLGHHNVFHEGENITAIIDWEDALAGDPIFDIAYWGTFVRDEMRVEFLEGYTSVTALPSDFEYRYWLYYLRIALSKTVHRHHFKTPDRPGRPPASQRIQKALSNLRNL